jgi:glutamyl-tRNA synthetase
MQKPGAVELLAAFREQLAASEPFEAESLEKMTHVFVAARGAKIGDIVHPLRVAVTGQSIGLGLFDSLAILGKASCLARIERTLRQAKAACHQQ